MLMNGNRVIQSIILWCLLDIPIQQSVAQEAPDQAQDVATLKEVVVVGSRVPSRSAHDSPVPVDVLEGKSFRNYGVRDMDSLLAATVPSYNVNQQPIGDASTLVRPANLRGLSPDSTLILVNGKRRHRSSVITFLGGGISDGSHAPDLAAIPAIALKRVEVLRDGAAAQYGSDAIAGVMNFVLKDAPDSGTVEARWGQFYEGDGDTRNIAGNLGVPLPFPFIQSGFANFSFEYGASDPTDRSVQRADAQALIDAGNKYVRQPHTQVWGAPEFHYDYKLFGNLGLKLNSRTELYAFGNYAQRKIEGGFFYRNPNTRPGVFGGPEVDGVPTVRVADLTGEGCPVVPRNDAADYADVIANLPSNCFMFNEKFPGGFTPTFGGVVQDWSAAVGIRGDLSSANVWLDDWHYDLSAVFGHHSTDFFMTNTINPQLAGLRTNIPTNYDPGAYIEWDHVINLDFSRSLENNVFSSSLNLALGLEYRQEEFEVQTGEKNSWFVDNRPGGLGTQGFGIGSNGFPGISPSSAGKNDRGSYAAYLDLETNVAKDLLVGLAGRFEEYETFGDTLNGKVDTRWQATSNVALRGSISTGFRAPTVGQANVRNVTTQFTNSRLADDATLPPSHPVSEEYGATPLKPEKSFNLSAGTVVDFVNLSVTIDYYRVKVQDRIGQTDQIRLCNGNPLSDCPATLNNLRAKGAGPDVSSFTNLRYFTNAFDTTTQGIDVVATYPTQIAGGKTTFTFAGNWNQTRVTDHIASKNVNGQKIPIITDKRIEQLEQNLPNFRFTLTADHLRGPWRFLTRLHYYDDFVEYSANADTLRTNPSERTFVDVEASYTFRLGITVAAGGQNVFNTYPSKTLPDAQDGVGMKYPESSPYGFNGGFYYFRALYAF